jgi:hypothetical protein
MDTAHLRTERKPALLKRLEPLGILVDLHSWIGSYPDRAIILTRSQSGAGEVNDDAEVAVGI